MAACVAHLYISNNFANSLSKEIAKFVVLGGGRISEEKQTQETFDRKVGMFFPQRDKSLCITF